MAKVRQNKKQAFSKTSNKPKTLPTISELFIDEDKVTDKAHYDRFLVLSKTKWVTSERFQQTTDIQLTVDLFQKNTYFVEAISHLPLKEVRTLRAKRLVVEYYYSKMITQRSLATGKGIPYVLDLSHLSIEQKKTEVLELFGKMFTIHEVHRTINQDWGLDVSKIALEKFRVTNIDKITELQQEYTRNFTDVRLGYKKSRLEEYSWLYNETKNNYLNTKNKDEKKFLKDLLESIKREVEGDLIRIEGDINMNIEATINVHIQKEVMKKLPINELVITRIAAKLGINPLVMLWRLQTSYYSKFTGFKPTQENVRDMEPEYPSAFVYDLDKLNQMNTNRNINVAQKESLFDSAISLPEGGKEKAKTIKEILKEKMLEKQRELKNSQTYLDGKDHEVI